MKCDKRSLIRFIPRNRVTKRSSNGLETKYCTLSNKQFSFPTRARVCNSKTLLQSIRGNCVSSVTSNCKKKAKKLPYKVWLCWSFPCFFVIVNAVFCFVLSIIASFATHCCGIYGVLCCCCLRECTAKKGLSNTRLNTALSGVVFVILLRS